MTKYKDYAYFLTIILTHQDAKADCALIEVCGAITVAPSTQVRKAIVREDWLPRNPGDQERHTSNSEASNGAAQERPQHCLVAPVLYFLLSNIY